MLNMKKLIILLSVVAVSFAVQAGEGCAKDKAACSKEKAAACDKANKSDCAKVAEAKGCSKGACPAKASQTANKKPLKSPKDS